MENGGRCTCTVRVGGEEAEKHRERLRNVFEGEGGGRGR